MEQTNEELGMVEFQCHMENLVDQFMDETSWKDTHTSGDWLEMFFKWLKSKEERL